MGRQCCRDSPRRESGREPRQPIRRSLSAIGAWRRRRSGVGEVVASSAFPEAITQLLITLEYANERVDELVIAAGRRFLDLFLGDIDNIATAAAGTAKRSGNS